MSRYYLAVDIGASSGRHILGSVQDGKIVLEEVYRFENGLEKKDNQLCWNFERLFTEIKNGLKRCRELGKIPVSVGIDTWGVDFVLLDENDSVIGNTVAYRDARTTGMDEVVAGSISPEDLYARTGIQKMPINTIYQLAAVKQSHPEYLKKAKSFLMVPEYFNFLLTGVKKNEYTNASTTQLVNAKTKTWDYELIEKLGFNSKIFGEISLPKTVVGRLSPAIQAEVGFDCEVVLPATHDTGSAVMAVPANDGIYLSSGTWSLMGVERMDPNCSEESRKLNFTNEGGYDYRFRFLKNIMGLWIIQSARRELDRKYSFDELCDMARQCGQFISRIDVNDPSFLSPANMTQAIKDYCAKTGQQVPQSIGELFACIYHSLAKSYGDTVREIETVTGCEYPVIHIVGGGAKDDYLDSLTAQYTRKKVMAGPIEATALGNLLAQMLKDGVFADLTEGRAAIARSFEIKEFI
ncbi:MAG TPA: rhamnulokinase [Caproiciproducens sp.]|nr:rhamnulokinase [Caproiciproducens sp.]